MRVLVVCYSIMSGFGGGVFAARSTVNALAAIYEDVTMLFPVDRAGDTDDEIAPRVRQVGITDPLPRFLRPLRSLLQGTVHRFRKAFLALLDAEQYDLVVFHNSKASRKMIRPAREAGAKVVVVHDNYEYEYTKDNFPFLQLLYLLPITVRGEREAVRESDLNLVLSSQDRDLLRSRYAEGRNVRFEVLGVFEYKERPLPELRGPVMENVFVITGNLGARQTLDSLLPWLDVYWPVLQGLVPGSRLVLAGKNPSSGLKERLRELGAQLVDTPQDMGEILMRSRYYICPTCKGGGVKLRVMDGLRYGLPCLVHEVSARGYDCFRGRNLFAYDSPASFRDAVARMTTALVDRHSAQETYASNFSFRAGVARMEQFLSSLS